MTLSLKHLNQAFIKKSENDSVYFLLIQKKTISGSGYTIQVWSKDFIDDYIKKEAKSLADSIGLNKYMRSVWRNKEHVVNNRKWRSFEGGKQKVKSKKKIM